MNILSKYQYESTPIEVHNITLYLTSRKEDQHTRVCSDPHGLPLTKVPGLCGPELGSHKPVYIGMKGITLDWCIWTIY